MLCFTGVIGTMNAHAGMQQLFSNPYCLRSTFMDLINFSLFCYIAGFLSKKNLWNANIQAMMVATGGNAGAKPVVFLGHSMGGAVVYISYLRNNGRLIFRFFCVTIIEPLRHTSSNIFDLGSITGHDCRVLRCHHLSCSCC